ncbi:MAG: phosphodiester glycosidase family protein [Clostridia bacterium]|nr:phosphodiester glycosidase family protein [Clostridia bacterium]
MKRNFYRIICFVLIISAFVLQGCTNVGKADGEPTAPPQESTSGTVVSEAPETTEPTPPPEPVEFSLNSSYVLIRATENRTDETNALMLLARGLKSAYGVNFNMETDSSNDSNEFEILVGETNRPESAELVSDLSYYDWTYKIVSTNVIAVCGGSPEATLAAARAFLENVCGYTENEETSEPVSGGHAAELQVGTEVTYRHNYGISSLKLGEHDVSEYTVVTADDKLSGADKIVDHFNRMFGAKLPVTPLDSYAGGPAIFFGCADAYGSHLDADAYGDLRYFIEEKDGNIVIDFKSRPVSEAAAERFVDECTPKEKEEAPCFSFEHRRTGMYIPADTNGFVTESVTSTEIADGVVYEEYLYRDSQGLPVRSYILTVAPGAASFATSMPGDLNETGQVSNIPRQVYAAQRNGKNVIAGINADFFAMGGTNVMSGLCIKDGILLHKGSNDWFGITKDGEPVIERSANYEKYEGNLITAVGGIGILLRNDAPLDISSSNTTRAPRTVVGIKPDGTVVLCVVDGRQPELSNGATLADMAELMASLGCRDAINLDGGGSSTFVLCEDGKIDVKNSPSDGTPRPVANGLMVILP